MLYLNENNDQSIKICSRNDEDHEKDVIPLTKTCTYSRIGERIAACNKSSCVYIGRLNVDCSLSVSRIYKDADHVFTIVPWLHETRHSIFVMAVSTNGNLITVSYQDGLHDTVISIYRDDGSLQHEMRLSSETCRLAVVFGYCNILEKENGNLILAYVNDQNSKIQLAEIDMSANALRRYMSSAISGGSTADYAGPFVNVKERSPVDCCRMCLQREGCMHFAFHKNNGSCHHYKSTPTKLLLMPDHS